MVEVANSKMAMIGDWGEEESYSLYFPL